VSSDQTYVPMNDLSRGLARDYDELMAAAASVFRSGYVIRGPHHKKFETSLSELIGVTEAIGLGSGTDALELAMKAAMPKGKSTVLTAANAGGYSSTAARRAGYSVIWADVDPISLCVTADSVAARITDDVGVVVSTHLYGNLTDQTRLVELCRSRGIRLVEDCAQAIGANIEGKMAGTWGDIAAVSFYPTKNLGAVGDGGAVLTSDVELAAQVRQLSQYGWSRKYEVEVGGGVNSRLDEIQAAFLQARLPGLQAANARRRSIVARYVEAAQAQDANVITILPAVGEHHAAHLAVARSPQRARIRELLRGAGVHTDIHFPVPDHFQPGFAQTPGEEVELPETELASREVFSLPCFPEMTESEIDQVCRAISGLR
jgi:aminotransferase EvaB